MWERQLANNVSVYCSYCVNDTDMHLVSYISMGKSLVVSLQNLLWEWIKNGIIIVYPGYQCWISFCMWQINYIWNYFQGPAHVHLVGYLYQLEIAAAQHPYWFNNWLELAMHIMQTKQKNLYNMKDTLNIH